MLNFLKYMMGPVLVVQGRRMGRRVVRLPEPTGVRRGIVGEALGCQLRLLVLGDSSAAGIGVSEQRLALASQVAANLAALTRCSIDWQLIAKTGATTASAMKLLDGIELEKADVAILSLGTNDITRQRSPEAFLRDYKLLVEKLKKRRRRGYFSSVVCHRFISCPQPLNRCGGTSVNMRDGSIGSYKDGSASILNCGMSLCNGPPFPKTWRLISTIRAPVNTCNGLSNSRA